MIILEIDAHKRTHTIVAVDERGTRLSSKVVAATPTGHVEALKWAAQWADRRLRSRIAEVFLVASNKT